MFLILTFCIILWRTIAKLTIKTLSLKQVTKTELVYDEWHDRPKAIGLNVSPTAWIKFHVKL